MWVIGNYNSFVRLDESVNTAWSQVENQYQRRYDLIPNLVSTVQGIADQEQAVFQGVADARARIGRTEISADVLSNEEAFAEFQAAQANLGSSLSRLLVAVEAYPELRSSENFLALQTQLEGTENRIANERRMFNETVQTYNTRARAIPGVWFVSLFGFDKTKQQFESVEGAEQAPSVDFQIGN
jgi:LemA protein